MGAAFQSMLLGCAALVAVASAPSAQIGAPQLPEVDWTQNLGASLPLETSFQNLDGEVMQLGSLFGERPLIMVLVYFECPMLCNLVMNGLLSSMRSLSFDAGGEFDVLVVGIDPGESLELMRKQRDGYVERYGREAGAAGWHFLRGDKPSIDALAEALGYRYTYVPETDEYAHPAGIAILTPGGQVARILYGSEFGSRDLKFSLMEAANGSIGSPIDKLILRCFHYDPARGVYGLAIMRSLQISGSLLVLFLAFCILRMARRGQTKASTLTPVAGGRGPT